MKSDVRAILDASVLGVLATANDDGTPWATPLHIFYDDTALYWFSKESSRHAVNCQRRPKVSVSVFSPDETNGLKGVYVNGSVVVLGTTTPEAIAAQRLVGARLGRMPKVFEGATAYALPFGTLNADTSYGNCWYFYS